MFKFGHIVKDNKGQIGVVVREWQDNSYDVYIRNYENIETYSGDELRHYTHGREIKPDGEVIY